jgi:hypothetical protein
MHTDVFPANRALLNPTPPPEADTCPPKSGYTVRSHSYPVPSNGKLIEYPADSANPNRPEIDCATDPACPGYAVDTATGSAVRSSSSFAGLQWRHAVCLYVRNDRLATGQWLLAGFPAAGSIGRDCVRSAELAPSLVPCVSELRINGF